MKTKRGFLYDSEYEYNMRGTVESIRSSARLQETQYIIYEDRIISYPEKSSDLIIEKGDFRKGGGK